MLYYENQLNLGNIYSECAEIFAEQRPEFLDLMDKYLDIDKYISYQFKSAFYANTGRPRSCSLHGYLSALILQKIFNIPTDSLLILILTFSSELRNFCGIFGKVPDASKWTRFKQDFCEYIELMFIDLVDVTEPICQAINPTLANMISYDTSGIEAYVTENNAKYINDSIRRLKSYFKAMKIQKSDEDIYNQAYKQLPTTASSDSTIRKMYANGHFCYARKFGIITNGLGIPRHIDFFDEDFKKKHKDFIFENTDSPDFDKTISDNKSLKPMITDFYSLHPTFKHNDFLADAAFDAVDTYEFLLSKNEQGDKLFNRAFIPLNSRSSADKLDCPINDNGIPLCPKNHDLLMKFYGTFTEKNRPTRTKWICPKLKRVGTKLICYCDDPCTDSKYGRVKYIYPNKNFRLYPGTLRGTEEWSKLYKIRTVVEQSINHIKSNMGIANRKTRNAKTTKADVFLAGVSQLVTVIIADSIAKPQYIRSIRKLAC